MKKMKVASLLLMFALSIGFIACNNDDSYYYAPNDLAYGALGNVSPNSGDLYIYADQNQVNDEALNYNEVRGYYNFYTGDRWFILKNQDNEVLDSLSVSLNINDVFTVFATGTYDEVSLEYYSDSVDYPGDGFSNVRIINLSPDAPAVDVYMDSELVAEEIDFKEATDFMVLARGSHTFSIYNSETDELLLEEEDVSLGGGHTYTLYTKGFVAPISSSNDVLTLEVLTHF